MSVGYQSRPNLVLQSLIFQKGRLVGVAIILKSAASGLGCFEITLLLVLIAHDV